MSFQKGYAVGGVDGPDMFLDGANFGEAVDEAQVEFPEAQIYFDGDLDEVIRDFPDRTLPNPRDTRPTPTKSLKSSGLHRLDPDVVLAMSVRRAHCLLAPFFVHFDGCPIQSYGTTSQMAGNFIGETSKMEHGKVSVQARKGNPKGLLLMPHDKALEASDLPLPMKRPFGFCIGSSPECRALCLLYTGNNPVGDESGPGKLRKVEALLTEPEAFMRMLIFALKKHKDASYKRDLVPYFRFNMLSDIPWELVMPELFDIVKPVRCYDYTKVEGRQEQDNYDLTFSFNGHNWKACEREMDRGLGGAVVFWKPKTIPITDIVFRGRKVTVDGNVHDLRPLDPPGALVGLDYRVPLIEGERLTQPPRWSKKFVVPAFRDRLSGLVVVPQTPASTGAERALKHAEPKLVG